MTDRPITHKMPEGVQSIACLGDSITEGYYDEEGLGWVGRFAQLLAQDSPLQYNVRNFGISGDTVTDAWHNLVSAVSHKAPDILLIKIGVNDTCIREGVEPETVRISKSGSFDTWTSILNYTKLNNFKTAVIGPLPVEQETIRFEAWDDGKKLGQTAFRYEQTAIKDYNDGLEKLCNSHGVPFIRLFEDWINHDNLSSLLIDGLHPNAKGHALLATQIFKKFKEIGF